MINVYGSTGFIGDYYSNFNKCLRISRNENNPSEDATEIIYFISTIDNYNIFEKPKLDIETNLLKLIDVLEAWRNRAPNATFNFISSWFVYGKKEKLPVLENEICDPCGFYSITKRTAEQMLISYCQTYKLNYKILRLTNIIGPKDNKTSSKKNAITYLLSNLIRGNEIYLYDDGSPIRDFMHVDDCVSAINSCIKNLNKNDIVNISNSNPISLKELIEYCIKKYNLNSNLVKYKPTPEFHRIVQSKNMWLDNKKLLNTGYVPKYNLWQAIDDVVKSIL